MSLSAAALTVGTLGCPSKDAAEFGAETGGEAPCDDIQVMAPEEPDALSNREHCWVSEALAQQMDILAGDQIRVYRTPEHLALYTVAAIVDEGGSFTIRMNDQGRARLEPNDETFSVTVSTSVTANELSEPEAAEFGELVEHLYDSPTNEWLLIAAPHGGNLEWRTDSQAEYLYERLDGFERSLWTCKGWRPGGGAFTRWHISSDDLSPRSFAGLGQIAERGFCHVVSFHGLANDNLGEVMCEGQSVQEHIIIGGLGHVCLKHAIKSELVSSLGLCPEQIRVIEANAPVPGPYTGTSLDNFVNWLSSDGHGGIQIEQSKTIRDEHWEAIAEAVARALELLPPHSCPESCSS